MSTQVLLHRINKDLETIFEVNFVRPLLGALFFIFNYYILQRKYLTFIYYECPGQRELFSSQKNSVAGVVGFINCIRYTNTNISKINHSNIEKYNPTISTLVYQNNPKG